MQFRNSFCGVPILVETSIRISPSPLSRFDQKGKGDHALPAALAQGRGMVSLCGISKRSWSGPWEGSSLLVLRFVSLSQGAVISSRKAKRRRIRFRSRLKLWLTRYSSRLIRLLMRSRRNSFGSQLTRKSSTGARRVGAPNWKLWSHVEPSSTKLRCYAERAVLREHVARRTMKSAAGFSPVKIAPRCAPTRRRHPPSGAPLWIGAPKPKSFATQCAEAQLRCRSRVSRVWSLPLP
ncbi:hypothetical protein EV696_1055 [Permianibacter aggregans]|uniref:Uncharacterized protein n=1 Tax=Permianibacter aggregans TaxID=1510150 RepID=A0A4R6UPU7_9GAMM|nr:hypothetical protein EV696_1055 [Permianibacter aggregans]